MAINYQKIGWDTTKYVNPVNMNQMDTGIKSACDALDDLGDDLDKFIRAEDELGTETTESRNADVLGGQYHASDITTMSNSINTINNNLAQYGKIHIEKTVSNVNGNNISTHTLSVSMKNYTDRNVVATCTGGSHAGCQIDSVIPKSATTIDVVWNANLPSSGTVNVTFMYEIG